jgi:hypothetical protein
MRTRTLCTLLVLFLAPLGAACKYNKETVPLTRSEAAIRVPNQQRIVSLAVEQAVEGLDFADLAGKSVSIEITGVFPHLEFDLLDYLRAQLVTRLTKQGVRVVNPIPAILLPGQAEAAPATGGAPALPAVPPSSSTAVTLAEPADYRLLVGVSWGGIDARDKVRTDEPLLTKQVGLGVGGLLAGLALLTIWDNRYGIILGIGTAVGSPVGAYLWYSKETPFPHTYTLIGRVRLLVHALPNVEGAPITKEASGESRVIVDETSAEGYMLSP